MKKMMVILLMLVALAANVFGIDRELTKAEKEVWEVLKSFGYKAKDGDIEGALSFIHEDYIGSWGDGKFAENFIVSNFSLE